MNDLQVAKRVAAHLHKKMWEYIDDCLMHETSGQNSVPCMNCFVEWAEELIYAEMRSEHEREPSGGWWRQ